MKTLGTILVMVFALCVATTTSAQDLTLAVEGNTAFAPGELRGSGSTGFGPSVRLMVEVRPNLSLTASAGFLRFSETPPAQFLLNGESFEMKSRVNAIPVVGGFRYYPIAGASRLYIGGQAGLHRLNVDSEMPEISGLRITPEDSRTALSFGPTFGVEFGHLDLSANYMLIEDANYFGFHLGYSLLNF